MKKDTPTAIDFTKWQTQTDYARDNNMLLVTVSQWVKRAKEVKEILKLSIWMFLNWVLL
jgi:hypothetical protein